MPREKEADMSSRLFSMLMELLFPQKCVFCRHVLRRGENGLCDSCTDSLPGPESRVTQGGVYSVCAAALRYNDSVRRAIHRFKFGGKTNYATALGRLMAKTIQKELADRYDVITWVPISAERKKSRGFDQSMLLAYAIALELEDVAVETLKKTVHTKAQSNLNGAAKRRKNVEGAYRVTDPSLVEGKRVLLIDDILTTGSTLSECSSALLKAGAIEIVCAVLARVDNSSNQIFRK